MNLKKFGFYALAAGAVLFTSCKKDDDDDAPKKENEVEVITDVKLIFTNVNNPTEVVEATAQDPDGDGTKELEVLDEINLKAGQTYELTFEIFNNLDPQDPEDIGAEIFEEDDEHQIFFSFDEGVFSDPTGNGNIDNASDPINYNDPDDNGYPVGLSTDWTVVNANVTGKSFRVNLQHQPGVKTATSGADDGDTDFDLTFVLNVSGAVLVATLR